ncbi:VOC family protein [Oceanibacterium hippocampi]|uniref:Glyoxalase/Bleomycin resistance protein/Dioxygenase superfamily protein n=1 Tax=Oceanibacterium hippocampi TaxID=745714 RepID=A0A1Y5TGU0_9PROT|nr:VOC family protein [Oceanibacterium hippocampi]SLN63575.1 Glyoxalase/Bleomycin resistance protein/Dioxygenase superfamily protein [Oceanibacterium hippocampi]
MSILGIDRITYGAADLATCRAFFADWGLTLMAEDAAGLDFEAANGCEIQVRLPDDPALPPAFEEGPTLREVVWGVSGTADLQRYRPTLAARPGFREDPDGTLHAIDPNGCGVALRVSRKRDVEVKGSPSNVWGHNARIDTPGPVYDRASPIEVGHVVFFTNTLEETTAFYAALGFQLSDRYPGRGHFLRCAAEGGHHDLFLLQTPAGNRGLNHVAFTVRDIHEVFGGGLQMSRKGWDTQLGPGRHPISSAYFWYFRNPAGGLIEYYADEDYLTGNWQPRDFEPGPTVFAEWAVDGGLDGETRRQSRGPATASGKFLTEKQS